MRGGDRMKRYSKEEKKEILKKFEESGKTATEFGKEAGVHRITLLKWSKDNSNKNNSNNDVEEIVELNMSRIFTESKNPHQNTPIILGLNGCVLQIGDSFNQLTLKNILDVVKQL